MQGAAQTEKATPAGGVLWRHVTSAAARRAQAAGAGEAQPSPARTPPARTPDRIIAAAVGRAAERVHGLPLFFDRVEIGQAALAELVELFPEQPLISVVEGPAEALGVAAICPGFVTSLIEMQAVGRISSRATPLRRPTRTDGAICTDFINACLAELGDELAPHPGCEGVRGYRYASFLDDSRPLELMLEDGHFHLLTIRLRAGDAGQRDGHIVIALPMSRQVAAVPPASIGAKADPAGSGEVPAAGSLAEVALTVPIDLVGVLCRRMISLGELRALSPGDMIALPPDVLNAATLETAAGQVLLRGKLGAFAGCHALRLIDRGAAGQRREDATPTSDDSVYEVAVGGTVAIEPPLADLASADAFRAPVRAGLALPG